VTFTKKRVPLVDQVKDRANDERDNKRPPWHTIRYAIKTDLPQPRVAHYSLAVRSGIRVHGNAS
jgi:hypothetical protein